MSFRMLSNRFNINLPWRKKNLHQRNVILSVNLVDPTQLGVGSYLSVKWLAADHSNKYFRAVILTLCLHFIRICRHVRLEIKLYSPPRLVSKTSNKARYSKK